MNGVDEYEDRYAKKINNLVQDEKYGDILKGFVNHLGTSRAISSKYMYLSTISRFLNSNNKSVSDIVYDDYTNFLSGISKNTQSSQIVNYTALKTFSNYLFKTHKAAEDLMKDSHRPKFYETPETIEKREAGFLTEQEIRSVIEALDNDLVERDFSPWVLRNKCIIMLLLSTGLRCSALCKLDVDSIDMNTGKLTTMEKGNKARRGIVLKGEMLELIRIWLREREKLLNGEEVDALFFNIQRSRMTQKGINGIVQKYCKGINKGNISPHKLRATYGIEIYKNTRDIYATQVSMGHSNPKTTELYIRGEKDNIYDNSANIMNGILFK